VEVEGKNLTIQTIKTKKKRGDPEKGREKKTNTSHEKEKKGPHGWSGTLKSTKPKKEDERR